MANYWVFVNGDVQGPFSLEQLIRVRGFSRRTQVCADDGSGHPTTWVSPADLPELATVFKTVDQIRDTPAPAPKPPPRPVVVRPPPRVMRAPAAVVVPQKKSLVWLWISLALLAAAGGATGWHYYQTNEMKAQLQERNAVQSLVADKPLPAKSEYGTIRQCLMDRNIQPRWEVERNPNGVFQATLSWYTQPYGGVPGSAVYAFEVNPDAQTVRGLNTAASNLLAEGFIAPPVPKVIPKPRPVLPSEFFKQALSDRHDAIVKGDYDAIWGMFSQRKRSDMIQAGISQTGFVRLQNLTHRLESDLQQTVLKTKQDDQTHMLALLRQSQSGHPDIFLKQQWVYENKEWRLDDEEKKTVPNPTAAESTTEPEADSETPATSDGATSSPMPTPATTPSPSSTDTNTPPAPARTPSVSPQSLPGISN